MAGRKADLFNDMDRMDLGSYEQMSRSLTSEANFLGELTEKNLWALMNRSSLLAKLKKRGFPEVSLKILRDDSGIDRLGIFNDTEELLIDLRLSKKRFVWGLDCKVCSSYDMIVIEWLSTRDPRRKFFLPERPQLPGQPYPGLGCLKNLLKMMYHFSKKIDCDGFLDVPDHLHLSIMYSKSFYFVEPEREGMLRSLLASLKNESLYTIAWASVTGSILHAKTHESFVYKPSGQVFPVSSRLRSYFESKSYCETVESFLKDEYYIDHTLMQKNKALLLETQRIEDI